MSRPVLEDAARAALRRGVDAVADAAGITLGPGGRDAVIGGPSGAPPVVTRDGATVADAVRLADPYAGMGACLVREAAAHTRSVAGDGTTTTVVLAQAVYAAGLRAVVAGAGPIGVRYGIETAAAAVVDRLTGTARPVTGEREAVRAASAAAGDRELGELVGRVLAKTGPAGVITVEEAHVPDVEAEFVEGMRLDKGLLSPFMVTHPQQAKAVLEDAYVLLHHGRIVSADQLLPVLERVAPTGRPLLVVADSLEPGALSLLVMNRLRGTLLCSAVAAPALGARRLERLEDLAVLTGGQVVAPEKGLTLALTGLEDLGRAARVVVTSDSTTVIGGMGSAASVRRRSAYLAGAVAAARSADDREVLAGRLAGLTGGVCVVRVGGQTDPERAERMRRVTGAVAATRAAMEEGVLPGGGAALVHAAGLLDDGLGLTGDERAGVLALRAALSAPLRRIARNAGEDGEHVVARVAAESRGWNASTGRYGDLLADGVLDPVRVTRTALESAVSVAGLLLTAGGLVADARPRDEASVSWRRRGHGHHHASGAGHSHGHTHGPG
ncbi:60 kDa chaperonin 1 [Streptomyces sp. YIM 130001]|uniref:chaperonin GroEL n=1 Tax=Streptomyces sp. YIM 130001 TaxID=2259644 RepID=UPI000E654A7D|nr:chaperonin GroEL [Streptomyces sp. YIM 130001]RII17766.1 60 kDa chaperonin 1 [Streptomyces sp. YIM 130001]